MVTSSASTNKTTTIRVQNATKDKLIGIGKKNQSFDSIVSSLLQEHYKAP